MNKIKTLLLFLMLCAFSFAQSEIDSVLIKREQHLVYLLNDLRSAKNNQEKDKKNLAFKSYLEETIKINGAYDYPFAQLKTMGSIKSTDNKFRLFNWNVEQDDRSNNYFCFVVHKHEKKGELIVTELRDNSKYLAQRTEDILDDKSWYGALYYKIIPVQKGSKTVYTVLGWDGNVASNTKLVDVISFTGTKVRFGSPIFKMKDGLHKRLFFEHSKKAFMSLNYDADRGRIIFDHLSPETPSLAGFYEYYVPDFSYDELVLDKNKWVLNEDVIGINGKDNKDYTLKYINKKNGEVLSKSTPNKWIDPTDKNAPIAGQNHVAVTPNTQRKIDKNIDNPNKQEPQIKSKRQRRNEFSMNPYYYKRKWRK